MSVLTSKDGRVAGGDSSLSKYDGYMTFGLSKK